MVRSRDIDPPVASAVCLDDALPEEISSPRQPLRYDEIRRNGVTFRGVAFDARDHRLVVVDQPGGPGSAYPDAAAVARSRDARAVVNGGFFTPEGLPLGAVVAEGDLVRSIPCSSSLGSAVWLQDKQGRSAILRSSRCSRERRTAQQNLLQSGPFLVEHGRAVGGLDHQKHSARTLLLWDGGQRWWLGISSPLSLATLAELLARQPPSPWKPVSAMNLDGGRSSELWVAPSLARSPIHIRPPWNRPVRNFLVLIPRH